MLNCSAWITSGCCIEDQSTPGGSRSSREARGIPRNRKKLPARTPTSILAGQRDHMPFGSSFSRKTRVCERCSLSIEANEMELDQHGLPIRREDVLYKRLCIVGMSRVFDN